MQADDNSSIWEYVKQYKLYLQAMKELDELKEKCVQAMKDVDAFVDEHYEELIEEMRNEWKVPSVWEAKIVSNCGAVHGCFRINSFAQWHNVIYNNGKWMDSNFFTN